MVEAAGGLDDGLMTARLGATQRLDAYQGSLEPGASAWLRLLIWYGFGRCLVASAIPGTFWRRWLLRLYGARLGIGGCIKPGVRITKPWNLILGDHCWLGEDLWIDNLALVRIGDQVCLSQGVYLCTGNHDYRRATFDLLLGEITIESQAWIAAQAVLAPGTHVGAAAVVGLGAVASGVIPAGAIVRGNPAVVVGWR